MHRFASSVAVIACGWVLTANPAAAQDPNYFAAAQGRQLSWAEKMFDKLNHDFGTVARGADVVLRLKVTNQYNETIHISDAHTSCNCISARILTNTLKTWEEGIIEVKLNTLQYSRERNANVIISIDQPQFTQITIPIHAYIRTDVVIEPGSALLGTVPAGESAEHKLRVTYAGSSNWQISSARSRNPNIICSVRELSRQANGGAANIAYELSVKLAPNTPPGDLREQIVLLTNDVNSPQIPVLVEGRVITEYTVTPPAIALQGMKPGDRKEINIVIRGQKPFAVEKIESNSGSESYQVKLPQKDRFYIVQMLKVIVKAPDKAGPLDEVFTVTVAGQGTNDRKTIEFKLSGKVLAGEANSVNPSAEAQRITTAKPATP
ncbi:MAG: DUF1573 domain-containing protein [Planctomycetota bacterium]